MVQPESYCCHVSSRDRCRGDFRFQAKAYLPPPLAALSDELPIELPRILFDGLLSAPMEREVFMSLES